MIDLETLKGQIDCREIAAALIPGIPPPSLSHKLRCPDPIAGTSSRSQALRVADTWWNSFATNRGGDAIDLVRYLRGCSFKKALDWLAQYCGVEIGSENAIPGAIEARRALQDELRLGRATLEAVCVSNAYVCSFLRRRARELHRQCEATEPGELRERMLWELAQVGDLAIRVECSFDRMAGASWDGLMECVSEYQRREKLGDWGDT